MKETRIIALLFLVCMMAVSAFATAQYPDKIFYNGKEYMLHTNPMEAYFERKPDKRPKGGIISSALWRGYVAIFEIESSHLFLKDIQIMVRKDTSDRSFDLEWKSAIADVVPKGERLKIDWFTGLLVLPHGKQVNYVHMGYGSTYENYILIEVASGNFNRAKEFGFAEYEKFKDRQFAEFKKTPEYKKHIDEARKEKDFDQKFMDDFLRSFVTNYTSKILVDTP